MLQYRNPDGTFGDYAVDTADGCSGVELVEQYLAHDMLTVSGPTGMLRGFAQPGAQVVLDPYGPNEWSGFYAGIEKQIAPGTCTVTWFSHDGWLWLNDRIVYPTPANAWNTQNVVAVYQVNAPVETVILDLINKNLASGAQTVRRLPGLTVPASAGRGYTYKAQYRFQSLGDAVALLAEGANLKVSIGLNGTGLIVTVDDAPDLSADVQYGTGAEGGPGVLLTDATVAYQRPEATQIECAAGGVGTARLMQEGTTSLATLWGRLETFSDRRDTTDSAEVTQAIEDAKLELDNPVTVSASIPDDPGLVLGVDVPTGAKVGLWLDGDFLTERVRRIETVWDVGGVSRNGFVGSSTSGVTREQLQIRSIQRALRRGQP